MPAARLCPQCGAELPDDAPAGFCPRCLLQQGIGEGSASPASVANDPTLVPRTTNPSDPAPGTQVRYFGDYEILEEIARGGMGVVYKARQVSLDRTVALKMILAGHLASEADVQRFYVEAKAAANLQHPNIVAIHEIGQHEGQHYFSMDYVEGQSLAQLARESPLPAARAAEYVRTIAEAIEFAHRQGTLHRDVKPSNILIDAFDQPRVTDFGLAKRIEATESALTTTGSLVGTPSYMSPEQAGAEGGKLGPASDVYSLGAVLYELVTGRPPFLAESLVATLNHVLNTEPVSPRLVNPNVPRDLETICLKCLQKDPLRRYPSSEELAKDLGRFLRGEPIQARPPSVAYRLKKFTERNRGAVIAAALVAVALLTGTAVSSWEALRATFAEKKALGAADAEKVAKEDALSREAEAKAREAETNAVLGFVEDHIIAAARPEGGLGRDVTLRKAIQSALPSVHESFPNAPLIEARLRGTLARSFYLLGDARTAVEQETAAQALLVQYRGPDDPNTLRSMNNLAYSYDELGRHGEALRLREETLAHMKTRLGPDDPDTLRAMNNLANSYDVLGRRAEALKLHEETLSLMKTRLGADHPDTLRSMNNLAISYASLGRHADALKLREETLALRRAKLGHDHPQTLTSMANLANSYYYLGRHADALRLREEALPLQKAKLGPDHPDTLRGMNNLALSYDALGRHADALKLNEETLALMKTVLGRDHADTLRNMGNLAITYTFLGRDAEALKLNEETLALQKIKLGADHPDTLSSMHSVAMGLVAVDRAAEAVPIIDECFQLAIDKPVHAALLQGLITLRLRHFEKTKDASGCRQTAAMWEQLGRTDFNSLYNAACYRAVSAAVFRATAKPASPANDAEADRGMVLLEQAVAAGYKDAAHMRKDKDLDSLRTRDDFKKLIAELEKKSQKAKP
ncbi:MAG TPA: tetratricopeptide repeat protein [Planctomycetaceae bacterium]|nr:tetratricopeptide repeat protein [Planctomycetaceae bacterium]